MTFAEMVEALVLAADQQKNGYEVVPYDLDFAMCQDEELYPLLGIIHGCANHGAEKGMIPLPTDPAGLDWQGPRLGGGKRWRDYLVGGFSIVHADSGFLRDVYDEFGIPQGIPSSMLDEWSFDQIRNDDRYREKWRSWAAPLVRRMDVLIWVAEKWAHEYWWPAWDVYLEVYRKSEQTRQDYIDLVQSTATNSRVSNSVKGVGKRVRGGYGGPVLGWPEQTKEYVEYKRSKRGDDSAERAQRQADQALRVGALVGAYRFQAVD